MHKIHSLHQAEDNLDKLQDTIQLKCDARVKFIHGMMIMKDKNKKKKETTTKGTSWVVIATISTLILTMIILLLQKRNQVIQKRQNEHKVTSFIYRNAFSFYYRV